MYEDGEIDDEEIWDSICEVAAKMGSISVERAREILEDAGFHAYGHTGIVEAVEIVIGRPGFSPLFEPLWRHCDEDQAEDQDPDGGANQG
jgi:hypothetical protein